MCCWRRVNNYYIQCGHLVPLPDEHIDCAARNCKFSSAHPSSCTTPQCTKSCWQYHQFPQQYAPQIDGLCPNCLAGNGA